VLFRYELAKALRFSPRVQSISSLFRHHNDNRPPTGTNWGHGWREYTRLAHTQTHTQKRSFSCISEGSRRTANLAQHPRQLFVFWRYSGAKTVLERKTRAGRFCKSLILRYLPGNGFEPIPLSRPDPKSGASANFATPAQKQCQQCHQCDDCQQFSLAGT
jgi:hypothetical protein